MVTNPVLLMKCHLPSCTHLGMQAFNTFFVVVLFNKLVYIYPKLMGRIVLLKFELSYSTHLVLSELQRIKRYDRT